MHRSKKSRDSTIPRGSQYIDGQLIHTATQQKLYYSTHMCTVFRETLKPQEPFLRMNAQRAMDTNLKKRQAHGFMNILEDRFTLERSKSSGKEPFRSWLGYREIEDIQRSKSKPEFFVLSVNSERSGQKYHEVYKCKTKDDAYKIESYIKQAMESPEYRLRDGQALDVVQVRDDPNERRSLMQVDFQSSSQFLDEDHSRHSTVYQATSPTPPSGFSRADTPERYSPVATNHMVRQEIIAPVRRSPTPPIIRQSPPPPIRRLTPSPPIRRRTPSPIIRSSPVPTSYRPASSLNGLDDVTYIDFEPHTRRPRVCDEGPVYMYFARQKNRYLSYSPTTNGQMSPVQTTNKYNSYQENGAYNYNGVNDNNRYTTNY